MSENASSSPHYRVHLWVLFASGADKAVILRRGPRRHYQLINWDLQTGKFTSGQWMRGYVRLCDLSPSGEKLIYWAHQYHPHAYWNRPNADRTQAPQISASYEPLNEPSTKRGKRRRKIPRYLRQDQGRPPGRRWTTPVRRNEGVWTAISRPPYFSALAIWPGFGHWTGGGIFVAENDIILQDDNITPKQNVPIPDSLLIRSIFRLGEGHGPLETNAWHMMKLDASVRNEIAKALKSAGATWIEWVAPRKHGTLLFACDGRIYRLKNWQKVAAEHYLSEAEELADFRAARFEQIAPPDEAMQW